MVDIVSSLSFECHLKPDTKINYVKLSKDFTLDDAIQAFFPGATVSHDVDLNLSEGSIGIHLPNAKSDAETCAGAAIFLNHTKQVCLEPDSVLMQTKMSKAPQAVKDMVFSNSDDLIQHHRGA